ncbi:NAC domain-containing protein 41-like isoform X1 [Asparagus officinalis]|uniref:NAC domain-containing protein 41-like isoform X1 n=1 Tax=Asparagus officinalis TaxID=4686 RepID=UPI00098E47B2|nr:NAC domain-containing protein 41-like isoform X1 [Asparagus officinalis]
MAKQENGSSTHEICEGQEEKDPKTLPDGFRFLPSEEVIITTYLRPKALGNDIPCKDIIVDVNVYDYSPAQLAGKWQSRSTPGGYWRIYSNKPIKKNKGHQKITIGTKNFLEFWEKTEKSTPRKDDPGKKTEWLMHEYTIEESKQHAKDGDKRQNGGVLNKIYRSSRGGNRIATAIAQATIPGPGPERDREPEAEEENEESSKRARLRLDRNEIPDLNEIPET